jgi:TrmH family RNA methyltransferase
LCEVTSVQEHKQEKGCDRKNNILQICSYNFASMGFNKITNAQIKQVRFLQQKKYRQKYNQFIVEGLKSVDEFLKSSLPCVGVFGNEEVLQGFASEVEREKCFYVNNKQLEQLTGFKSAQQVIAIFEKPHLGAVDVEANVILALDEIRDPGNLGTIIRTADWFGYKEIVCSNSSVDCYNGKVIQASMGSLSRMKVHYLDLPKFIKEQNTHTLLVADMSGENYKEFKWGKNILLIGNEGRGASDEIRDLMSAKITIPRKGEAESLNAAISAAILLAQID